MRSILAALAAFSMHAAPVSAQTPSAGAETASPTASQAANEASRETTRETTSETASETPGEAGNETPRATQMTAAVRQFYVAALFDTGMFDGIVEQAVPQFRAIVQQSEFYLRGNERRRAALDQLIADVPGFMREEVMAEVETMAANVSPRLQSQLNAEEMASIAELMQLPIWRRYAQVVVQQVASGKADGAPPPLEPSSEEMAQLSALEHTPGAEALMRMGDQFWTLVNAETSAATARIQPRVQARMERELCEALGRDCPRPLRDRVRGA